MLFELIALVGVASLFGSGAARLKDAKARHSTALQNYKRILHQIEITKVRLESQLDTLGKCADAAFAKIREANKILEPLQRQSKLHTPTKCEINGLTVLDRSSSLATSYSVAISAAAGSLVGTAIAAGSWTAVSLLGTASTGVAISGLHGVAATNAALAWFGGGSLATSGGGMIAGKLALVNFVFLPAVAFAGVAAHLKASDISDKATEIEAINNKNNELKIELDSRERSISPILGIITSETQILGLSIARAQEQLFRFGVFSRIYKHFRYIFKGYYYSSQEMYEVETLGRVVDKFISRFETTSAAAKTNLLTISSTNGT
jgi:hypothetical protein